MTNLQIENRKGRLKLNDGVRKESADKLIEQLETLYGPAAVAAGMKIGEVTCAADDALERVEVEINSPGGSVLEGQRIYNALRGMSARGVEIQTTVNGLAASMGSVILMAGDVRAMTHGSRVMIHEASTAAWGDARVMRQNAALLESISAELAGIYSERTGIDSKKIREMMYAETWMSANDAKDLGFVHSVIKDGKAEGSASKIDIGADDATENGMSLIDRIKSAFADDEKTVSEFDKILVENSDLNESVNSLRDEVTKLLAEIVTKDETIAGHVATIAERDDSIEKTTAELVDAKQAVADLEAAQKQSEDEHAAAIEGKEKELAEARESAAKSATEALAAIGQDKPLQIEGNGDVSETPHLDRFNQLKGMEAASYYREHKKTINAEARKANKLG